jgi:hypothetical protein
VELIQAAVKAGRALEAIFDGRSEQGLHLPSLREDVYVTRGDRAMRQCYIASGHVLYRFLCPRANDVSIAVGLLPVNFAW